MRNVKKISLKIQDGARIKNGVKAKIKKITSIEKMVVTKAKRMVIKKKIPIKNALKFRAKI